MIIPWPLSLSNKPPNLNICTSSRLTHDPQYDCYGIHVAVEEETTFGV